MQNKQYNRITLFYTSGKLLFVRTNNKGFRLLRHAGKKVSRGFQTCVISHADILTLTDKKPIAEASGNIILTERGNGVICAVETQNAAGYVVLNGKYKDLISGGNFAGETKIEPYDALVLKPLS